MCRSTVTFADRTRQAGHWNEHIDAVGIIVRNGEHNVRGREANRHGSDHAAGHSEVVCHAAQRTGDPQRKIDRSAADEVGAV